MRKHARREGTGRGPNKAGERAQEDGRGPGGGVGAQLRDPLEVAVPGWRLGRTVENGVREGLRGFQAAGAGGRGRVVPGGVGAEVAFTRPHLVKAAPVEFGEAHCNMCTCSGNSTQERAVQDLLCLVDLYLVYLI